MPFEDRVVTRFEGNVDGLINSMEAVRRKISQVRNDFGNLQKDFNKASRGGGRVGVSRGTSGGGGGGGVAGLVLGDVQSAKQGFDEIEKMVGRTSNSFRRTATTLTTGNKQLDILSIKLDRASMAMWKFQMAAMPMREVAMGAGAVAAAIGLLGSKMVDAGANMEVINRQFTSLMGSRAGGADMAKWLTDVAQKIRYTIRETAEAGRLLQMEGFDPKQYIMLMADLAAGVNQEGITIVNATRAFVDATNGHFRRLKETFQITKEDVAKFAKDAFGPGGEIVNQSALMFGMTQAIMHKYGGMNQATMDTVRGQLSNLEDATEKAFAKFNEIASPFIKDIIGGAINAMNKAADAADGWFGKLVVGGGAIIGVTALLVTLGATIMMVKFSLQGLQAGADIWRTMSTKLLGAVTAEQQLLQVSEELAEFQALSSIEQLEQMRTQLALTKALAAEQRAMQNQWLKQHGFAGLIPTGNQPDIGEAKAAVINANKQMLLKTLGQQGVALEQQIAKQTEFLALVEKERNDRAQTLGTMHEQTVEAQKQLTVEIEKLETLKKQKQELLDIANEAVSAVADTSALPGTQARVNRLRIEVDHSKTLHRMALNTLAAEQARYGLESRRAVAAAHTAALEENRLRALEAELATMEAQLAVMQGIAATSTVATGGVLARAGAGFVSGAGAVFGGVIQLFRSLMGPLAGIFSAIAGAGAGGVAAFIGAVSGAAVALAALITPVVLLASALNNFSKAHEAFRASIEDTRDALENFSALLGLTKGDQEKVISSSNAMKIVGGIKLPEESGFWKATKEWARSNYEDIKLVFKQVFVDREATSETGKQRIGMSVDIGQQVLESVDNDKNKARAFLAKFAKTAEEMGINVGISEQEAYGASIAEIKQMRVEASDYELVRQKILDDIDRETSYIRNQGALLDNEARRYVRMAIASGRLSDSEKERFEAIKKSVTPAKDLSDYLGSLFDAEKQNFDDLRGQDDLNKRIEDAMKEGKSFSEAYQEQLIIKKKMEDSEQRLISLANDKSLVDKASVDTLRSQLDEVRKINVEMDRQVNIAVALHELQRIGQFSKYGQALGMGAMGGALFGPMEAARNAEALANTPVNNENERWKYFLGIIGGQMSGIQGQAAIAEMIGKAGPRSGISGRVAESYNTAARIRNTLSQTMLMQQGMVGQVTSSFGGGVGQELAGIFGVMNAEQERQAQEAELQGYKMIGDAKVGALEAEKAALQAQGYESWNLLSIDKQILDIKYDIAEAENDAVGMARLNAEWQATTAKAIEDQRRNALGTVDAWAGYMQALSDNGFISQDQVDQAKRIQAQYYMWAAQQSKAGSQEQYQNMTKALNLMGEETKDKWDGIIGKILGAPEQLISEALSEGTLASRFGILDSAIRSTMRADIASSANNQMTITVKFGDMPYAAVDGRVKQAMGPAMAAWAQGFAAALAQ